MLKERLDAKTEGEESYTRRGRGRGRGG